MEGLTSNVDHDRVRCQAASNIRHKNLQMLHKLCAETDEVMFRVWGNVLSATWDIRAGSEATILLRYGNLSLIRWQVAADRLSRQFVQNEDMVMAALLLTMCRDGRVVGARADFISMADAQLTHIRACTVFALENMTYYINVLVDTEERDATCIVRDALVGILVEMVDVPAWSYVEAYAIALPVTMVALRRIYESSSEERRKISEDRRLAWVDANGEGFLVSVWRPEVTDVPAAQLNEILIRAMIDVFTLAPESR